MNYPFKKIVIDINNYFFLRKTIKTNMTSIEWERFKLRVDWIGRIYTVINLPPEVVHSPDAPEEIRPAYILEESRPLNEYLTKLNLQEILIPEIEAIPESISYLLLYRPYFQKLSWRWVFTRLAGLVVLIWLQYKFGIISWICEIITKAYEYVF
jgi:hypothetical protein